MMCCKCVNVKGKRKEDKTAEKRVCVREQK